MSGKPVPESKVAAVEAEQRAKQAERATRREEMHTFVPPRAPRTGELALYAILGALLGYELVAHFTHYRYGRTLSAIIVAGDHSKILALAVCARLTVAVGAVLLVLHLEGWLW